MRFLCIAYALCAICALAGNVAADEPSQYEWKQENCDQHILYQDGHAIGQWYWPDGKYYPWDGKENGAATHPPVDRPTRGPQSLLSDAIKKWCLNGVKQDKIKAGAYCSVGGRPIACDQIKDAFDGKLTDDSDKGWFTPIAKDDKVRASLIAEWNKLPADFRARYLVWDVPADNFSLQDRFTNKPRFVTEGDPSIILQDSKGVVLFRRPQGKAKYVAADFQDLLKADPDYKPELDPGKPTPTGIDLTALTKQVIGYAEKVPAAVYAVCVLGVLLLLRKK